MKKHSDKLIRDQILEEKHEIDDIDYNINLLKERILEKQPSHFSIENITSAFFGALLIGLTFVLKGALVRTALPLTWWHIIAIIAFTLIIIFIQVYFISYQRVKDKEERLFGQFVIKRMMAIMLIALIVSTGLVFLLGINLQTADLYGTAKVVAVLWMACAIGSAIPGLLTKY